MRDRQVRMEVTLSPSLPGAGPEVHAIEGSPAFIVDLLDGALVDPRLIEARVTFPVEAAAASKVANPWTDAAQCSH